MSDRPGERAATRLCEAFTARDWATARAVLDDDINFSVGGTSPLAGNYTSPADVVDLMRRMVEISDGTLRFSGGPESYDVLISDAHVAVLVPFSAERDGRTLENSYEIWQFHAGEKIGGYGSLYVADQAAFDAFWS